MRPSQEYILRTYNSVSYFEGVIKTGLDSNRQFHHTDLYADIVPGRYKCDNRSNYQGFDGPCSSVDRI